MSYKLEGSVTGKSLMSWLASEREIPCEDIVESDIIFDRMSDLARHDEDLFFAIHGMFPMCIAEGCKERACDSHHVMGKGHKKNKEDRKIHSSIFGAAPLCRFHHSEGDINRPQVRRYYLLKIRQLIANSAYTMSEIDRKFIDKYADLYS